MTTRAALPLSMLAGLSLLAACTEPPEEADGGQTSEAADNLVIGLTYTPDVQFAPWYIAEAKDYFTEEGVSVDLRHHGASESLFGALEAGDEDLVIAGGDEMLQARSEGVPVVNVATLYETYPVSLITEEDSDITSPSELAGHTVGIPGHFGETWFGLLALLSDAGLDEDEVTIEEIGFTQQAALSAGHVDAVIGFSNNDAVQFAEADIPVDTMPLVAEGQVPLVGIGIGADEDVLQDHEQAVTAAVAATRRGVADVIDDPQAAAELSAEHVPGLTEEDGLETAVATLEETAALYEGEGVSADVSGAWQQMADFMDSHDLLADDVDIDAAVVELQE